MGRVTLPTGEEKARVIRRMFDTIAPRYDLVNRVMTFGMDVGWRRKLVASLDLPRDSLVLDVACGTGDLCRELERAGHRAAGFDFSSGMLASARTAAPLVQADVLSMPVRDGAADGITCGFALRNVIDPEALFDEFARVVRAAGRIAILEVSQPNSKILRWGHYIYFNRVVPLVGGLLSDRSAYRYLPESAAYLPDKRRMIEMLERAGFSEVAIRPLGMGAAQAITGTRT